jgi:hypothetical protein
MPPRIEIEGGQQLTGKQKKLVAQKLKPIMAMCKLVRKGDRHDVMGNLARMTTLMQAAAAASSTRSKKKKKRTTRGHEERKKNK